ncbi:unnamed protein product [Prorocentrum cordatum]|uniref:Uncharacterized protein n=1 Tax=Prorocentrum cordatum TaxID=2364126 RepID=A0ABN9U3I0_9DINO|nr:unnamed protein product [Polarella glacialis]
MASVPSSARSAGSRDGDLAGDGGNVLQDSMATCYLCEQEEVITKEWRGVQLSADCWNAVRSHRLQLKGNAKALKDSASKVHGDPDAWRSDVMPYKSNGVADSSTRGKARAETQAKLRLTQTEDMQVDKERTGRKNQMYSKRHYKSYRGFWDKVPSDDASEEFDMLQETSPHYDSDGEPCQRIKGHKYEMKETGRDRRTGIVTLSQDGDIGGNSGATNPPLSDGRVVGLGDLPSGLVERTPRGRSPMECATWSGSKRKQPDDAASMRAARQRKDPKHHIEKDNAEALFLVAKEEIMQDCVAMAAKYSGPKSTAGKLRALKDKHRENSDAPDCTDVLKRFGEREQELLEIKGALKDMKLGDQEDVKSRVQVLQKEFQELEKLALQKITTFGLVECGVKKAARTQYLAVRHQKGKVCAALTAGGYPPKTAKAMANIIHENSATGITGETVGKLFNDMVNVNPAEMITNEVCVWSQPDRQHMVMRKAILDKCEEVLQDKTKSLDTQMATTRWTGALTRLNVDVSEIDHSLPPSAGALFHDGNTPNLVTLRRDACRRGPAAFSMTGVGGYVMTLGEPIIFMVYNVKHLLDNGFLKSDAGCEFLASKSCSVFSMPAGCVAWIPYGFVFAAVFYTGSAANDKDAARWGHFVSLSVLSKSLAAELEADTYKAIKMELENHYKTETAQVWKDRAAVWTAFDKTVAAAE